MEPWFEPAWGTTCNNVAHDESECTPNHDRRETPGESKREICNLITHLQPALFPLGEWLLIWCASIMKLKRVASATSRTRVELQ